MTIEQEHEQFFTCPHCFERISVLIDLGAGDQTYVEDCEVCCRPIEILYVIRDGKVIRFEATILA